MNLFLDEFSHAQDVYNNWEADLTGTGEAAVTVLSEYNAEFDNFKDIFDCDISMRT